MSDKLTNPNGGDSRRLCAECWEQFFKTMKSHELAKILLENDDLPIAVHANNHTYASKGDEGSNGKLKVGILKHYSGLHVVLGNISKMNINKPNWYVIDMIHGDAPAEW